MNIIDELVEYFKKFPGVGPRQANRFVYYLLKQNQEYLNSFGKKIPELKNKVRQCRKCFRFFTEFKEENIHGLCSVCCDANRNQNVLMILSTDADFESIERSDTYNGTYFILGGSVPILNKNPERIIRLNQLVKEISKRISENTLKEIILALNANPEGEHTTEIIKTTINQLISGKDIKISVLGRGLSTGTEIEYSDPETLKNAFLNRG